MTKKTLIAITAVVLVLFCTVGATLAWLVANTNPVTNMFTYGDINITLAETTGTSYKMIPGSTLSKDPKVTVKGGSEACWLFVEVTKTNNPDNYLTYSIADGWTKGDGTNIPANVYYRAVPAADTDQTFSVLAGDKVTVNDALTKDALKGIGTNSPTLTFKAYAVQQANVTSAAAAWAIANPTT